MIHRLAVTPGEPAGIGPDILITLAQHGHAHEIIAVADPQLLRQRAALLGLPLRIREVNFNQPARANERGELAVFPIPLVDRCEPGVLNANNSAYVLDTLDCAIQLCRQQQCAALVTGPVNKGIINDAHLPAERLQPSTTFQGHTEYLANRCGRDTVVMMLATQNLRVALATTHLPLRDVAGAITADHLQKIVGVLHHALRTQFSILRPRILVCGLNPHAGEDGHLGSEEKNIITPTLDQLRQQNMNLIGPLPADTLFTPKVLSGADAVLAMYHDQGLPVLKYQGFGKAVNITLGLPIVRTSVDHGTALDLVGTGKANIGSLQSAIDYAITMAGSRPHSVEAAG